MYFGTKFSCKKSVIEQRIFTISCFVTELRSRKVFKRAHCLALASSLQSFWHQNLASGFAVGKHERVVLRSACLLLQCFGIALPYQTFCSALSCKGFGARVFHSLSLSAFVNGLFFVQSACLGYAEALNSSVLFWFRAPQHASESATFT